MALVMTREPVDLRSVMQDASWHSRMLMSCISTVIFQSFMGAVNAVLGCIDSMIYAVLQVSDRVFDFLLRPSKKYIHVPARLTYHVSMIWRFWPMLLSRFVFVFGWSFAAQFIFQYARLTGYI